MIQTSVLMGGVPAWRRAVALAQSPEPVTVTRRSVPPGILSTAEGDDGMMSVPVHTHARSRRPRPPAGISSDAERSLLPGDMATVMTSMEVNEKDVRVTGAAKILMPAGDSSIRPMMRPWGVPESG